VAHVNAPSSPCDHFFSLCTFTIAMILYSFVSENKTNQSIINKLVEFVKTILSINFSYLGSFLIYKLKWMTELVEYCVYVDILN